MGWTETLDKTAMTLSMLENGGGFVVGAEPSWPVGIAQIAGDTAKTSWQMFLGVMALRAFPWVF